MLDLSILSTIQLSQIFKNIIKYIEHLLFCLVFYYCEKYGTRDIIIKNDYGNNNIEEDCGWYIDSFWISYDNYLIDFMKYIFKS